MSFAARRGPDACDDPQGFRHPRATCGFPRLRDPQHPQRSRRFCIAHRSPPA